MALPKIEVEITADTIRAEKGLDRVERGMRDVGSAADRASTRTTRFSGSMNRTSGTTNRFRGQIQNTAFQLGDFATQVGAGTSASIALGQQLPQLLGGFGVLGAVLGAVAAVAVPLSRAISGLAGDAEMAEKAFGVLHPAAMAVADAFGAVRDIGIQMAEVIINNLDRILITAGTVAAFFAGKWVAGFVAARVATFSLTGAVNGLKAAMARFLPTAILVAVGELVFRFVQLVQAAGGIGKALGLLKDVFIEVGDRIKDVFFVMDLRAVEAAANIKAAFLGKLADIIEWLPSNFVNKAIGALVGPYDAAKAVWKGLPDLFARFAAQAVNKLVGYMETAANSLLSPINAVRDAVGKDPIEPFDLSKWKATVPEATNLGSAARDAFETAINRDYAGEMVGGLREGEDQANREAGAFGGLADLFSADLSKPLESLGKIRDTLAGMKEEGITLGDILGQTSNGGEGGSGGGDGSGEGQTLAESLMTKREQLEAWYEQQKEILANANEEELAAIGGHNEAKLRLEQQYQNKIAELRQKERSFTLQSYSGLFGNMAQIFKAGGDKLVGITKAFSIAQGLLNSYRAFTEVLADPALIGRPFLRTALAASTLGAGLAQVASMRSISSSGGGGGGGGGAAGGASGGATPEQRPTQNVMVDLTNATPSQVDQFQGFADTFNEVTRQGLIPNVMVRSA